MTNLLPPVWKMMLMMLLVCTVSAARVTGEMICSGKVNSFSAARNSDTFYQCNGTGTAPLVKKCPDGQIYWAAQESCRNESSVRNDWALRPITENILGRNIYMGDMYNVGNNEALPGASLWNTATIRKYTRSRTVQSQDMEVFTAASTYDRLSHLKISPQLALEYLAGIFDVHGSSEFVTDTIHTEKSVAVILTFFATTHTENLPWATPKDHDDLCSLRGPTHVITSLVYGLGFSFVFTKDLQVGENREEVSKALQGVIEMMPSFAAKEKVNISSSISEIIKGMHVKYFGDILVAEQPSTFEDCVRVYHYITNVLIEKPDSSKVAQVRMQLTPITRFCEKSHAVLIALSRSLLDGLISMLDELQQTALKANTLASSASVHKYLPLKHIIKTFIRRLHVFQASVKGELQTLLPNTRNGIIGESALVELLTNYAKSPFSYTKSQSFLETRQKEIDMVDYMIQGETFKGTSIVLVDYRHNDEKVLFDKHVTLMLKLNILPPVKLLESFLEGKTIDESYRWFNNDVTISKIGDEFHRFINYSAANCKSKDHGYLFSIGASRDDVIDVYAQHNGKVLSSNFIIPQVPEAITPTSNSYNAVSFSIKKPDNTWVNGFTIRYWRYGEEEKLVEKTYRFAEGMQANIDVNGLLPNVMYQFSMKYVTVMGSTAAGPSSAQFLTRPCSRPMNLRVTNVSSTHFTVYWDPPLHRGKGVNINRYKVIVKAGDALKTKIVSDKDRTADFDELDAATRYQVSIKAKVNAQVYNGTKTQKEETPESLPALKTIITNPEAPSTPIAIHISYHSLKTSWFPPRKIARGAYIQDYFLEYEKRNNLGNETMPGSKVVHLSQNKTFAVISDLVQGTTYAVRVKVATSLGNSEYSGALIITTPFVETDLSKLRRSVEKEIENSVSARATKLKAEVEADISAATTTLNSKLEEKIAGAKSSVKAEVEADISAATTTLNSKIVKNDKYIKELTAKFEQLGFGPFYFPKGTQKYLAYKEYPAYGATFVGFGYASRDDSVELRGVTLIECIRKLHDKRQSDASWNSLAYQDDNSGYCVHYKNGRGLNPSNHLSYFFK